MSELHEQLRERLDGLRDRLLYNRSLNRSVQAFHAEEVEYLCLSRNEHLTERLLLVQPKDWEETPTVAPHSHAYSFQETVLSGHLRHWTYSIVNPDDDDPARGEPYGEWTAAPYGSEDQFTYIGPARLARRKPQEYGVGQSYFLGAREIHTIRPGCETLLYVCQLRDTREARLYLPGHESSPPDTSGLYRHYSVEGFEWLLARIRRHLNVEIDRSRDA